MFPSLSSSLPRAGLGAAVLLSLVAGLLAAPAQAEPLAAAAEIPPSTDCPATLPASALTDGMTGEGLTVVRGATPQPFAVEILGVLENGIGAGRDMILIEVSDLPGRNVISAGGGIWAGMSGSPVYVDDKLIGAVGYGFSASPSPIGGVTPAADMLDLLDLPSRTAARTATAAAQAQVDAATTVSLSATERRKVAARATAAVPRGNLEVLPAPMSVSGLYPTRVDRFQAEADAGGLPVVAYAASRAAAPSAAALTRPEAGGNFGAALSYGDVSAVAFGTTTAICGNEALAFGHPFNYAGPVSYGASNGNSLSIIKDNTAGSYKLAGVTAPFGTVDQDRLAGIRADLTRAPVTTPVRSRINNTALAKVRTGQTRVADRNMLPALTYFGLLSNYDVTFDEIGDGRATLHYTITGRRAGDKTFTVKRSNRYASRSDISGETALEPALAVETLLYNDFERVTIDKVDVSSAINTTYRHLTITKAEVSVDGGKYTAPRVLRVKAGATVKVRVTMRPYQSSILRTTTLTLTVPRTARGRVGSLQVLGGHDQAQGAEEEGCLISPEECETSAASSLDGVISGLTNGWRNHEAGARLLLEPVEEGQRSYRKTVKNRQADIVLGAKEMVVTVV